MGGLNKFDQKKGIFSHYLNNPDDPNSIGSNIITSIYESAWGMLWIGTDGGGLNKFDRESELFTHYINIPDDSNSLSGNTVNTIYEDKSSVIWV